MTETEETSEKSTVRMDCETEQDWIMSMNLLKWVDECNMTEGETKEIVLTTVFAPHIQKHAQVLLTEPNIGLCRRQVEIFNPKPSFPSYDEEESNCDKFQLVIPYAGVKLECMVIFQSSAPDCPPDFVFSDERFFAPLNQVESLCSWDVRKPDALLKVLKEIMQFYKKKQIQILDSYEQLSFEYLCLFQLQNFNEDDIEILVPDEEGSPVIFLIKLHVDYCQLFPDYYRDESDTRDYPLLLVFFPNRDSNRSYLRVYLSKKTQSIVTIDENFQLPDDVTDNYLTRYIIALENELKTKIQLAASRYERRRMYFVKFLTHFDKCIIKYDSTLYTTMTLLLEEGDFYFILEITLPDDFPIGTPALLFRSVYHYYKKDPFTASVDNYPYCPTWPLQKVLEETIKFITEYVPLFRQDSAAFA
ncbi:BRISC and BRCA1-A complex member 2-like isoform X1 [Argiope bruennichi]|uniref:BRISC and BRCA1-A complex member 2-like isoform X1 n=1 Tax=Argiope bruennichi TaxID=94029 RepID=UPI002494935A|nr:BRISC and BRCA1-A complex member 2-like isoform X1 [Argiope bruennichi]